MFLKLCEEYYRHACESAKQNAAEELLFRRSFFVNGVLEPFCGCFIFCIMWNYSLLKIIGKRRLTACVRRVSFSVYMDPGERFANGKKRRRLWLRVVAAARRRIPRTPSPEEVFTVAVFRPRLHNQCGVYRPGELGIGII